MSSGPLLAVACLAFLALSGCVGQSASTTSSNPPLTGTGDMGEGQDAATNASHSGSASHTSTWTAAPQAINVTLQQVGGETPGAINFTLAAKFGEGQVVPEGASWRAVLRNASGSPQPLEVKGIRFPANFSFSVAEPGQYGVQATVEAPGHTPSHATLEFMVKAIPQGPTPLLFDDAEDGSVVWTMHADYFGFMAAIPALGGAPTVPSQAQNSNIAWTRTQAEAHSGATSWTAPYHDFLFFDMVSPALALEGKHSLSFWVKGDVENNTNVNLDGLHILVVEGSQSTEVLYLTDAIPQWTQVTIPLDAYRGKTIQINFSFQSDAGCSGSEPKQVRDTFWGTVGPVFFGVDCGTSTYTGYFVDDITVR